MNRSVVERILPEMDAVVPRNFAWEVVGDGFTWLEGPVWRPGTQDLLFSDIPENRIHRFEPKTRTLTVFMKSSGYTGSKPFEGREPGSNGLTLDGHGRLLICQHGDRRLVRREANGELTVIADAYQGQRLNSPNDVIVSSEGEILFTDPPFGLPDTFEDAHKELEFQGVYSVRAGSEPTLLIEDLRAPNGIALGPDEKTLYITDVDPARPGWWRFPRRADGTLGRGELWMEARPFMKDRPGGPDGIEVDDQGRVFGAGPGGIYVFDAEGRHLGTLLTGEPTGNLEWGDDGRTLYVTANHQLLRGRFVTGRAPPASIGKRP
ncbi:MAG: SMP-30/gluconolactonase/LRE family protein [Myxococcota bacterium]